MDNSKKRRPNPFFKPGEAAPDIVVLDEKGHSITLSSLWKEGPLLLAAIRHFG
ncbi:MAG TPA: hypothetical protein VH186_02180 [Chloroflexia bacterium]|nr:hypothetical protein [Chloroflexia bacterium]